MVMWQYICNICDRSQTSISSGIIIMSLPWKSHSSIVASGSLGAGLWTRPTFPGNLHILGPPLDRPFRGTTQTWSSQRAALGSVSWLSDRPWGISETNGTHAILRQHNVHKSRHLEPRRGLRPSLDQRRRRHHHVLLLGGHMNSKGAPPASQPPLLPAPRVHLYSPQEHRQLMNLPEVQNLWAQM